MDKKSNVNHLERTARIFNVQKYNIHDGPGVRTLIFFKGCPLRCKWCANPEGLRPDYQVLYKRTNCIDCGACVAVCPKSIHSLVDGKHEVNREISCIGCRECEKACYQKALQISGEYKTISELLEIVREDKDFYMMSGGGVTIGGGECTGQMEALISILQACKDDGINTAIETSGYFKAENIERLGDLVDLFLYDIKHMDPLKHKEWTGVNNEIILENLKFLLEKGYKVRIRMPMLEGVNDSEEEIKALLDFIAPYKYYKNFDGIDVLPYHKMGVGKYDQLDMHYPIEGDPAVSEERLDKIEKWIKDEDVAVNLVRH
ncbi:choline TMA-lyase-activating enzyme [Peptoniphilaceae bacterium SGI.131]